jgi:hypothetical protein
VSGPTQREVTSNPTFAPILGVSVSAESITEGITTPLTVACAIALGGGVLFVPHPLHPHPSPITTHPEGGVFPLFPVFPFPAFPLFPVPPLFPLFPLAVLPSPIVSVVDERVTTLPFRRSTTSMDIYQFPGERRLEGSLSHSYVTLAPVVAFTAVHR